MPITLTGQVGFDQYSSFVTLAPETVDLIRADTGAPIGYGTPYVYTAVGTPEPFTITESDPSGIVDISAGETKRIDGYVDLDGGRDPEDLETIHGTLTYTYVHAPAHPDHGHGNDPIPDPVPEPASLALLGFGVLGIGLVRRRAINTEPPRCLADGCVGPRLGQ